MRHCAHCRHIIRPQQDTVILNTREAGSGAPTALVAHRECLPEQKPAYAPPPPGARQ
jgi:hypothetical protein